MAGEEISFTPVEELRNKEDVRPGEIIDTLWGSIESGSTIDGQVIVAAIDRSDPTKTDLKDLQEAAIEGVIEQAERNQNSTSKAAITEQAKYARVLGHVGLKLRGL